MSCYNGCYPQNTQNVSNCCDTCCNADTLAFFDGDLSKVKAEPVYVQKIYDAVLLKMQGIRTVQEQIFTPSIPSGFRIIGISGIKCRKSFNPGNISDPSNLQISADTCVSGASFVKNGSCDVTVVGPDGTMSEKILYADTSECDSEGKGTPIFGTQNISITGNVIVTLNLILMDSCGREICYPVTSSISVATAQNPLMLTGFFEMCMPSVYNTAILPRFTELCNLTCETRLATNNCVRDLMITQNNEVAANLIITLCIACEKKIIVPVELAVLSTGFIELSETSFSMQACSVTPQFNPDPVTAENTGQNGNNACYNNTSGSLFSQANDLCASGCEPPHRPHHDPCAPSCEPPHRPHHDPCAPSCEPPHRPHHDPCAPSCEPPHRPQPGCCDPFPIIR